MKKRLTDLEWEIMNGIWNIEGRISVRSVLEELYPDGEKAYTTVQTVMNKLEEKGFLTKEKIGLVNFYKPTREREDLMGGETRRFVDKIFDGSFGELAMYLIGSGKLSDEELADLKQLIERGENE